MNQLNTNQEALGRLKKLVTEVSLVIKKKKLNIEDGQEMTKMLEKHTGEKKRRLEYVQERRTQIEQLLALLSPKTASLVAVKEELDKNNEEAGKIEEEMLKIRKVHEMEMSSMETNHKKFMDEFKEKLEAAKKEINDQNVSEIEAAREERGKLKADIELKEKEIERIKKSMEAKKSQIEQQYKLSVTKLETEQEKTMDKLRQRLQAVEPRHRGVESHKKEVHEEAMATLHRKLAQLKEDEREWKKKIYAAGGDIEPVE